MQLITAEKLAYNINYVFRMLSESFDKREWSTLCLTFTQWSAVVLSLRTTGLTYSVYKSIMLLLQP